MTAKRRILAISGSYRDDGITDQAVAGVLENLQSLDADVEHIKLRNYPIKFCLNCRECMQQSGASPGLCVHDDGMAELVQKIEAADGYIFAAPTNFYSVTAIFKRFAERLAVYGFWPWGAHAPLFRKAKQRNKPAIIISSCAAPGLLGRLTYGTNKSLKVAAQTVGGKVVGSMVVGFASQDREPGLPPRARRRAKVLAEKLVA